MSVEFVNCPAGTKLSSVYPVPGSVLLMWATAPAVVGPCALPPNMVVPLHHAQVDSIPAVKVAPDGVNFIITRCSK